MRYRPSPDFLVALVIIGAFILGALYLVGGILLFEQAKAEEVTQCVTCGQDWRPDISHCFAPDETRELWDCIRYEEE